MCGLAGFFDSKYRREPDEKTLDRMVEALFHRGPDGAGKYLSPGIAFGHRRLAIIDVEGGVQPLFNAKGTTSVIFNGEIYNFQTLRHELEGMGYTFRTKSDTEVIVHAWDAWQEGCVERLEGMFAFAIWDSERETLLLARDRLGEKPLYYSFLNDDWLAFGSELKALLQHPNIPKRLDGEAIADYFTYGYVPDPKSIFANIRKLEPAHFMLCRRGKAPIIREYWRVRMTEMLGASEVELEENLRQRLRDAVQRQLVADVPLGAFLSGGVDSSAVIASMATGGSNKPETFTISFDDPEVDESSEAKLVADYLGTCHKTKKAEPLPAEPLKKVIGIFDEPFADSSAIPTYLLSKFTRENVTVALSGDGGDELFAGYRRYLWHLSEEKVRKRVPPTIRRALFAGLAGIYPKGEWMPKPLRAQNTFHELSLDTLESYQHNLALCGASERHALFSKAFQNRVRGYSSLSVLRRHDEACDTENPLLRAQYIDLKTYLPGDILVKVDRCAMANSLETRVPLLDHHFVEWACQLPAHTKLQGGTQKRIFKNAMRGHIPDQILDRPKRGFAPPLADWLRGPLDRELNAALSSESFLDAGLFDQKEIQRLHHQHRTGSQDHSAILWALLVFSRFLDNGYEPVR